MSIFQKVRVKMLCPLLLVLLLSYLVTFSLNTNMTVSAGNSLENLEVPSPLVPTGCPTATFSSTSNVGIFGSGPQAATAADFNNDGILDLATANILSNNVSLLLGNKTGVFNISNTFSTEQGNGPRFITSGDFNRDGSTDIATANFNSNSVAVLLGNGQGNFSIATNFSLGDGAVGPIFIISLDFNRDGILDLVTANFSSANISILIGDGTGNFNNISKLDIVSAIGVRAIVAEDFNRDGNIDLAVTNFNSDSISILLGDGAGGVSSQTLLPLNEGKLPFSIVAGDFNRDGSTDLATADGNDLVSVFLGSPSGSFAFVTEIPMTTGSTPQSIQIGDLNQDGNIDLLTANSSSNNISVLLGGGNGSFSSVVDVDLPGAKGVIAILAADFNQDTKLDLVTINQTSGNASILLNGCTIQCKGRFGNALNFPIGGGINPQALIVADINRDGVSDIVTANSGDGNVSFLRGNREGTFSGSNNFTTSGVQPFSITSGDFNRDGNLDLATVDVTTANVYMLLGNGQGSFGIPTAVSLAGSQPVAIISADFNRDGFLDLVTANAGSSTISLLLGLGNGQFLTPTDINLNSGQGPFALATADFNRDGFPDLATTNLASNNVSIFTGSTVGFSPIINSFGVNNSSPRAITTGDINRDGAVDLVVANLSSNNVSILFGDGTANFNTEKTISLMGALKPTSILVVDTNLDGNLDVVTANSASNNISLLLGDGLGGFVFGGNIPVDKNSKNPSAIAATDINQDGAVDLVVANSTSTSISLFLNTCGCSIAVSQGNLVIGQKLVAYNQTLTADGGIAPYIFSLFDGALPQGINLSSAGQISGTTQETGVFNITVNVADSGGCSINQSYSLLISSDPATNFVIEAPQDVNVGQPFDITVKAVDKDGNPAIGYLGTIQFSSSDPTDLLPPGFTFNFADLGKRTFSSAITLRNLGTHRITVVDRNNPSLSSFMDFKLSKITTKTNVGSLENPTNFGSPASFTATVLSTSPVSSIPTGTITFIIDGIPQSPVTIVNGEASFVTSALSIGNHQVVTRYDGDNLFNSSVSNVFVQVVTKASNGGDGGGTGGGGNGDGGDGTGG